MKKILLYDGNKICTEILYDKETRKVDIYNHTDDMIKRAFGIKSSVTWDDLEIFLESRCFSKERADACILLADMGLNSYDPWEIVRITEGRKEEDQQWLQLID